MPADRLCHIDAIVDDGHPLAHRYRLLVCGKVKIVDDTGDVIRDDKTGVEYIKL